MTIPTYAEPRRTTRARLGFLAVLAAATAVLCAAATAAPAGQVHKRAHAVTTLKIVADLPLSGDEREETLQMVHAIRFVLKQAGNKAGKYHVRFESRDDATPRAASGTRRARGNARSYAADPTIVGVIGTYNSGCAAIEIPILNRVAVAMSPRTRTPGSPRRRSATSTASPRPTTRPAGATTRGSSRPTTTRAASARRT